MNPVTATVAATAALVLGGGLFAAQAEAGPAPTAPTPVPTPVATERAAGQVAVGWFYTALTDVQRKCLAAAGVHRPSGQLTDDQRKELRASIDAALAKCGVQLPARASGRERLGFGWAALTDAQQKCLADTALTRPVGRLTAEQRAAVRQSKLDAATACGVGR
ncbi:MAG: hypothetical protein IT193_03330 [Propionibacteriaceae bacterium]|nr:hypothetical protein [Propionibacteriaceae bacterium]